MLGLVSLFLSSTTKSIHLIVPPLSSNTDQGFTLSRSSAYSSNNEAYNITDTPKYWTSVANSTNNWLKWELPQPKTLKKIEVSAVVQPIITLQGSNDSINWTTFDGWNNKALGTSHAEYEINNNIAYKYYKIMFSNDATYQAYLGYFKLWGL